MPNKKKKVFQSTAMDAEVSRKGAVRSRPDGLVEGDFSLCKSMLSHGSCKLGGFCISAHSVQELKEWKKGFLAGTTIKTEKKKTLAGKLLEHFAKNENSLFVSSEVPNIVCTVEPDLHLFIDRTPFEKEWKFLLHSFSPLLVVFLLHEEYNDYFAITDVSTMCAAESTLFNVNENKEWTNTVEGDRTSEGYQYSVSVVFKSAVFGSFRQCIIFDFGLHPMLQKELVIDVNSSSESDSESSDSIACKLQTEDKIWSSENSIIVPFDDSFDENDELLKKYPFTIVAPTADHSTDTLEAYRAKMHYYLSKEEAARFRIISRFTINIKIDTMTNFLRNESLSSYAKFSQNGALFGRIKIPSTISEDTEYGKTMLSCNSLLISWGFAADGKRIAYMSTIENFSKSEVYVNLSSKMVSELKLKEDKTFYVDVQFLLNRVGHCEMHQSLDRIECFGHLYPIISPAPTIDWDTYGQFGLLKDANLNVKQREAVIASIASIKDPLPPVVIIGPYGTGKTFTLANAIPVILNDTKNNILICTHSNSAADVYIKDYLHDMRQLNRNLKPLRIYYTKRWRKSVHADVLKYCLYDEKQLGFIKPTMANILDNNVIITTINNSFCLNALGIKPGFFTHIIIDEAAQIMECAALIPLSLANEKTRIILAGDYMQLGEENFSEECKQVGFSVSLLERLFNYYPNTHPCKILLQENYRSQEEIVKLTSDLFYDGKISAKCKPAPHLTYKPLCFFAASGDDSQDKDSTSFCNHAEIVELANRIKLIKEGWPMSWGNIDDNSFGIITPYLDQVAKIRKHMKNMNMGNVSVERIYNVQGKEFKVTLLSTVRTRKTCTQADDASDYGFMSNPKLLTTAITRAKFMVGIVGDPVALCTVGKCRTIWSEIVERCGQSQSLYGMTLEELNSALGANELQRIHGLNPMAEEFVPRGSSVPSVDVQLPGTPMPQHVDMPVYPVVASAPIPTTMVFQPMNQMAFATQPESLERTNHPGFMTQHLPQMGQTGHMQYIAQQLPIGPMQMDYRAEQVHDLRATRPVVPMEMISQQLPSQPMIGRQNISMDFRQQQLPPSQPRTARQATEMELVAQQLPPVQRVSNRLPTNPNEYGRSNPVEFGRSNTVDFGNLQRPVTAIQYLAQQRNPQPPNPMMYVTQQQAPSRVMHLRDKDILYISESNPEVGLTGGAESLEYDRSSQTVITSVSDMWDGNPLRSIWSLGSNEKLNDREAGASAAVSSNIMRSLTQQQQDYKGSFASMQQMKQATVQKPMDQLSSLFSQQANLAATPASMQVPNRPYQVTGQGVSNIMLPSTLPMVLPRTSSVHNVTYSVSSITPMLSSSFQGATAWSPVMSRPAIARQENVLVPSSPNITHGAYTTSSYGANASSFFLTSPQVSQNPVSPARLVATDSMTSPQSASSQRSHRGSHPYFSDTTPPSRFFNPSLSHIQNRSLNSSNQGDSAPQNPHISPRHQNPHFSPPVYQSTRSQHSDSSPQTVNKMAQVSQRPLNFGPYPSISPTRGQTPGQNDFLTAHGIPIPSNQAMQNSSRQMTLQDLLTERDTFPFNLDYPDQNLGNQSSHVDSSGNITFLDDTMNINKRM